MYINLGKIKIHIGVPAAAFIAFAANFTSGKIYITALVSMLMHECVHLFFLFRFGCRDALLKISPGGIKLSASGLSSLNYREVIEAAISAPLMNLIAGLIFLISGNKTDFISVINLSVGAINLLPLEFTDGGRALSAYLLSVTDIAKAEKISRIISYVSLGFMFAVFFILMSTGKNYFFFLFFVLYCFSELISEKTRV